MQMKKLKLFNCKHCKESKPFNEMRQDHKTSSGIILECKPCRNQRERSNGTYIKSQLRSYKKRSDSIRVNIDFDKAIELLKANNCTYCDIEMSREHGHNSKTTITLDHVYSPAVGYVISSSELNLYVSCLSCNSSKGSDHIYTFYKRKKSFTPQLWTAFVSEFGRRLFHRELSDIEIEQFKQGFKLEADELRTNLEQEQTS